MISSKQFEEAIQAHSSPGVLTENDSSSKGDTFAMAFAALASKGIYLPKVAERKRAKPEHPKVGRWLGKLIHGSLRLVPEKKLRVLESVSLGERRFVTILQVEGRKFLIGGSSSNISMLAPLDSAEDLAKMLTLRPIVAEHLQ
jgi:hypothetical protein